MKILAPSAGDTPDQNTTDYVINLAKRFNGQLVVLRVLSENETEAAGKKILHLFIEKGKKEKISINTMLRRGDIASAIIEIAQENSVDLIVLGLSHGEIVAEWMNTKAMELTDIPVLLIPKWVRDAKRSFANS